MNGTVHYGIRRDAVLLQHAVLIAIYAREHVRNADPLESPALQQIRFRQVLGDGAAETADRRVFLDREDRRGSFREGMQRGDIERLDSREVQHGGPYVLR